MYKRYLFCLIFSAVLFTGCARTLEGLNMVEEEYRKNKDKITKVIKAIEDKLEKKKSKSSGEGN